MRIICLIGDGREGSKVAEYLEKIGFIWLHHYTTKPESKEKCYRVNDMQFMSLLDRGSILYEYRRGGYRYGIPRPFGGKNVVMLTDVEGYKRMVQTYGEQVSRYEVEKGKFKGVEEMILEILGG